MREYDILMDIYDLYSFIVSVSGDYGVLTGGFFGNSKPVVIDSRRRYEKSYTFIMQHSDLH